VSGALRWLREVGRGLVRNPGYKLLSLAIAVVAWLYVQGGQVVEAKVRARVEWPHLESLLPVQPLPASVTLTVGGPRNATRHAQQDDVTIPVDLSGATAGQVTLDFSSLPIHGLPANVQVLKVDPPTIRFTLDEVAAKKVRVTPKLVGDPADGYQVVAADMTPPVVSIRGPRSVLEKVSAVPTLPVDVSGMAKDTEQRVELDLPRTVDLVTDENLRVSVDVEPRDTRREFSTVPVDVWRMDGWRVDPETVKVVLEGPTAAVNAIDPQDVVVFVHLPDPPSRTAYDAPFGPTKGPRLRVLDGAGDDVRAVSVEPSTVHVVRQ